METLMTERALTADPDEPARPVREPEEKPKAAKASKVGKRPNWPEETEEPVEVVIIEADSTGFVVSSEDFEGDTYVYITGDMDVSDLEDGQDVMIRYYTDDDNDKVLHDAPQPVEPSRRARMASPLSSRTSFSLSPDWTRSRTSSTSRATSLATRSRSM
jgi:hypothetical protein